MGLIGQRMYGCYAEASEDCLLCVLSRSDLQTLIRRNPDVGLLILAEVERRFQEREFRGLPARLAVLLLREADASGTEGLVSMERKRIRLLDTERLDAYANTD
jgi:CRP/FNR family cyclic AMP-dependent transcriptional regulator